MKKVWPLLFLCTLPGYFWAQSLQWGGLQGNAPLLLTPSPRVNAQLQGKTVWEAAPFGMVPQGDTYVFQPRLERGWTWLAAFNFDFAGKKQNIFYYDSWVGTTQRNARTGGRKRNFERDVTTLIASNAYHIALQREEVVEDEIFLFVWSPIKQKVILELDPQLGGGARRLSYDFGANEARFIHLVRTPQEYTNTVWFSPVSKRDTQPLLTDWQFLLSPTGAEGTFNPLAEPTRWADPASARVNLPHTWNAQDLFDPRPWRDSLNVMTMYHRGVGWYRKKIMVPEHWRGRYVKVDFQGANQITEVWWNGQKLGTNRNGYLDFHFDVTPWLRFGSSNELIVKVDNRFDYDIPPHTADFNFQGGLYREVALIALHPAFVKRVQVSTPQVNMDQGRYQVTTTLRNKSTQTQQLRLITNLINPDHEIIQTRTREVSLAAGATVVLVDSGLVEEPLLWSPHTPQRYQVQALLYPVEGGPCLDQYRTHFGFRWFEWDAAKGFSLNGQAMKLQGVNVHQDLQGKGWAMTPADKRRDFLLIKAMGANFVRLSHYPHHPYVLELCDSLGLMVWAEIPVVNTVGRDSFIANAVDQMERMILRDYNHPSILIWGVGNEYYRAFFTETDTEYALRCTRAVAAKAKALDPYRPTVQAQNDLVDERIMDLTDIQGRNRYFGWYGSEPYQVFGEKMLEEHAKHPTWKLLVSEYGAEGKYGYHVDKPVKFDHSLTYQLALHQHYWEVVKQHDFIAGATIWNMFDFASWAKIGNMPHVNKKGMATYDRRPKGIFYYYQSQWAVQPMVYIWEHTLVHRRGQPGTPQPITVFSNCDEVALWVNGVKQETQQGRADRVYTWNTPLKLGPNQVKAVGYHLGEAVSWSMEIWYHHGEANRGYRSGKGVEDGY